MLYTFYWFSSTSLGNDVPEELVNTMAIDDES